MIIETRTIDTGRRRLNMPTVDGLEVRSVGAAAGDGVHPAYVTEGPEWMVYRNDRLPSLSRSAGMFEGHPAVFDQATWIGPKEFGFEEVVSRSAFNKSLADGADVRFVHNHNPDMLLARVASGTLNLSTDARGLVAVARMAPTTHGNDVAALLERGDISQMSFAFRAIKEQWDTIERAEGGGEYERRTLLEVALVDVSTVTWPAYDNTDAGLIRAAYDKLGAFASDTITNDSEPEPPTVGTPTKPPSRTSTPQTMPIDVAKARLRLHKE